MENTDWLYSEIGRKVRTARRAAELTQEQLATACNLGRTSITNIEAGAQQPPVHVLWRIADELGLALCDLVPSAAPTPQRPGALPDDVPKMTRAVLERISKAPTSA